MGRSTIITIIIATPLLIAVIGQACSDSKLAPVLPPIPTFTLKIQNYCVSNGFTYRDVFAFNSSAKIAGQNWVTDYDRDGLTDKVEQESTIVSQFGVSPTKAATQNADYSDLMIVRLGLGLSAQNLLPQCATGSADTDNDGLTDCTENYLQTDSQKADTDGDGIPDGIEFRFTLNPTDANDAFQSIMGDDLTNLQKIKSNIPVDTMADANFVKRLGITYLTNPSSNTCADMEITKIPILPVKNGNKVWVYVVEDRMNNTTGTTVLNREARWVSLIIPQEVKDKSTVFVNDGIRQQTIDGKIIPLIVQSPVGGGS